jgi:hypothetical protein
MSTTEQVGGVPARYLAVLFAVTVGALLLEAIWGAPWRWLATTVVLFAFGAFTPLLVILARRSLTLPASPPEADYRLPRTSVQPRTVEDRTDATVVGPPLRFPNEAKP